MKIANKVARFWLYASWGCHKVKFVIQMDLLGFLCKPPSAATVKIEWAGSFTQLKFKSTCDALEVTTVVLSSPLPYGLKTWFLHKHIRIAITFVCLGPLCTCIELFGLLFCRFGNNQKGLQKWACYDRKLRQRDCFYLPRSARTGQCWFRSFPK